MIGAGGSVQVNSDWNATSGVAEILNKPTIPPATTDASLLTSGTLADARLSSNVSLDNQNNNFSVNQTFQGTNNIAPNQTAASGSSLMTRDLFDSRLSAPGSSLNSTHYFALAGISAFIINGGPTYATITSGKNSGLQFYNPNLLTGVGGAGYTGTGFRIGGSPNNISQLNSNSGPYTFTLRIGKVSAAGNPGLALMLVPSNTTTLWTAGSVGLYGVPQPSGNWQASSAVSLRQKIDVNGIVFFCSTAGTTGSTQPAWPTAYAATVTDGTSVWRNLGPHTNGYWALAIGNADMTAIQLVSTGVPFWTTSQNADVVLQLRYGGESSSPFKYYASVETSSGKSNEVSVQMSVNSQMIVAISQRGDSGSATPIDDAVAARYLSFTTTFGSLL